MKGISIKKFHAKIYTSNFASFIKLFFNMLAIDCVGCGDVLPSPSSPQAGVYNK